VDRSFGRRKKGKKKKSLPQFLELMAREIFWRIETINELRRALALAGAGVPHGNGFQQKFRSIGSVGTDG